MWLIHTSQLSSIEVFELQKHNPKYLLASCPTFLSGSRHLVLLFLVALAICLPSLELPSLTLTPSISPKWCCFAHKANAKSSTTGPRGFALWRIYFCSKHTFLKISKLTSDLGYLHLSQTLTKCSDDLLEVWKMRKLIQNITNLVWLCCLTRLPPCRTIQEVWLFNFLFYFLVKFSCRFTG